MWLQTLESFGLVVSGKCVEGLRFLQVVAPHVYIDILARNDVMYN